MELDDLKIKWKSRLEADQHIKTTADLQKAIYAKTKSITGKIKRSLRMEAVFCMITIIGLTVIAFITIFQSLRIYFGVFSLVFTAFLIILLLLLRKVNRLDNTAMPVKENLEKIIRIISEYMVRNLQFTMALIPVCILLSAWLSMNEPAETAQKLDDLFNFRFSNTTSAMIFLGAFFTLFTVFMYYFTRWYLKKLYGKYLDQLKLQLKELENG